jgi:YfiH family protein
MINKLLIKPDQNLGKGITSFMLTKNYFEKHSIEFNNNSSVEEFVVSTLGVPIVWMDQVHGTKVQSIHENTVNLIEACDGLYTEKENIALAIKTADCLPLILCSKEGKELTALHVGWRGLHGGIVENAIMNFKCATENLVAWLAPCISSPNYEVGEDVYSVFKDSDSESVSSFKLSNNKDKWIFSLKQECVRRLQKFDIPVITNTFCTFKDEQLFYSYRRNSTSKRMVTLAWRQK